MVAEGTPNSGEADATTGRSRQRLLTPSKITAWLDCEHYLTLKHQVESGTRARPHSGHGSFAQLLFDKGNEHEAACLAAYEAAGLRIVEVPGRLPSESFGDWANRARPALDDDADVLYQLPLVNNGVRGIADFLVRSTDPATGTTRWEPVDAKLARNKAKPGHVLQLCFYAEAIDTVTGSPPERVQVWLGSGRSEEVVYEDVRPYWDRLRLQLAATLADGHSSATTPKPCDHCEFCEFAPTCEREWRAADALHYVAGLTKADQELLEAAEVRTLAGLAVSEGPVKGLRPERLTRLRQQAELQVLARNDRNAPLPFQVIEPGDDVVWGHGFDQMPEPDPGDIFLDFEGHPFWHADEGLFFLFGYLGRADDGEWRYTARWAHDKAEERERVDELVHFFVDERAAHPGMHVYHYNHTERSMLQSMAAEHAVAESALADLVDTGLFVDLLVVARNAVQVGIESYGLKHLERLTTYERSHDIDEGAGAVVEYELFTKDRDRSRLTAIAAYNEDDVRATRALRDWLVDHRPHGLDWRATFLEPTEDPPDLDELLERLHPFGDGTPERLLADLLGYWLREWRAYLAPRLVKLQADDHDRQLDDPDLLARLEQPEVVPAFTKKGKPRKWPTLQLRYPPQPIDTTLTEVGKFIYSRPDGSVGFAAKRGLDLDSRTLDLEWNEGSQEGGHIPDVVVGDDYFHPKTKVSALHLLVNQVLDPTIHGEPNSVTKALLRRDLPRFAPGHAPADGKFTDDLDAVTEWGASLDHSVLAIQGPPGTGKTFRGARIAHRLVQKSKRVGIMAMSHHAIDNFLEEIVETFAREGGAVGLRAIRKGDEPASGPLAGVTYTDSNPALADPKYNLVAATSWPFSGNDLRGEPVDVLLIDEAGQLALIDAVVASMAAESVVLLGDPLQLPQVAIASHPSGSGASALGHLLTDPLLGDLPTIPEERGVFLTETRRMHPDVCRFISDRIYERRLTTNPACAEQGTDAGTGLRWLRVEHSGNCTESEEEAKVVADEIRRLVGRGWTNQQGVEAKLTTDNVMVVAPYNDQVRLLEAHLARDPVTRGVSVGTVDKFQGREAPVVFFTMTSSSADDMPRGTEFLFSRHRLNVAISRAQCLAYLVCTQELLESRAKTVDDMYLMATLCAFVEYATP